MTPLTAEKTFNLFVYGTLKNPSIFRAVLGRRLVTHPGKLAAEYAVLARRAVLNGYKILSPDNTYLYAVPDRNSRIQGYIVGPLEQDFLAALRKYEGRNYRRRKVRVETRKGREEAIVFLGNLEQLERSFGYAFSDNFKQEILLREKIDAALVETEQKHLHTDEAFTRRAVGELHGAKIRDLVRHHFESGGISDYAIRHSLLDAPLPGFDRIRRDAKAKALAPNYLAMVVRQVIFNQIEEHIHHDSHYQLERMDLGKEFYARTISSLAALRIINSNDDAMRIVVDNCLGELKFPDDDLVDFVRCAVAAADAIYEPHLVKQHLDFIANHMGKGFIPLGAELEFSNIGHDVILDPQARRVQDKDYDGFVYFNDFALDVLTWKLGGHVDDHYVKISTSQRRGFFEAAPGNLSIQENISMPVTDDPWLLNQLIHQTRRFYNHVAPHSIHISMQLRSSRHRPVRDKPPALGVLKCLFALAGDPGPDESGRIVIHRLRHDEIVRRNYETNRPGEAVNRSLKPNALQFTRISRRRSESSDETYSAVRTGREPGRFVQQYKFMRLAEHMNYELITMALKGLQLGMSLGGFLTTDQYYNNPVYRRRFEKLLDWGANPEPLGDDEIKSFIDPVRRGLNTERRGKPAHSGAYIAWAINQIREMLETFNQLVNIRSATDKH